MQDNGTAATGSRAAAAGDERLRGPAQGGSKGIADNQGKGGGAHEVGGDGAAAAAAVGGDEKDGGGDILKPQEASGVDIRIAMIGNVDR